MSMRFLPDLAAFTVVQGGGGAEVVGHHAQVTRGGELGQRGEAARFVEVGV